ncbi:MAG: T9SS type A sorting domain-containing protein, partial [Cytophagales bacterium]
TAAEKDAGVFEVQRSTDGVNFVTIGTVKAMGNSNSQQFYSFKSSLAGLKGMQYYRIVEKSSDGSSSTNSDIRALFVEDSRSLRVIPNPNAGNFELSWSGEGEDESVSYTISNSLGALVAKGEIRAGELKNINLSSYSQGVYYISIFQTSGTYIEKIFVK